MLFASIISLILFSGPERPETSSRVHENVHESQVYFRWDKSNYEDNYRSNSQAADKVYNLMKEIGTERVDSVIVKAYASVCESSPPLIAEVYPLNSPSLM